MKSRDDALAHPPSLLAALTHHYEELIGYVRRRFGDHGLAREVVHDVCVQLLERPEQPGIRAPLALLRRISHDVAVDRCRAEDARRSHFHSLDCIEDIACPLSDQMRLLAGRQELDALVRAIDALPVRRRQVFVMHKIHQLPQSEVAARLNISVKMVEKQLRLGLAACRAQLQRSGSHA